MYCEKCGNQMNENAKFCSKCGHQVSVTITNKPIMIQNFTANKSTSSGINELWRLYSSTILSVFNWIMFILLSLLIVFGKLSEVDSDYAFSKSVLKEINQNRLTIVNSIDLTYAIKDVYGDIYEGIYIVSYESELKDDISAMETKLIFSLCFLIVGMGISFVALFSQYNSFSINRIGYIIVIIGAILYKSWVKATNLLIEEPSFGIIEISSTGTSTFIIILCIVSIVVGILVQKLKFTQSIYKPIETNNNSNHSNNNNTMGTWVCSICSETNPNNVGICKCGKGKKQQQSATVNMWRCPDCNSLNANYIGTCKCGKTKE